MSEKRKVPTRLSQYLHPDEHLLWVHTDSDAIIKLGKGFLLFLALQFVSYISIASIRQDIFAGLPSFLSWALLLGVSYALMYLYSVLRKDVRVFDAISTQRILNSNGIVITFYDNSWVHDVKMEDSGKKKLVTLYKNGWAFKALELPHKEAQLAYDALLAVIEANHEAKKKKIGLIDTAQNEMLEQSSSELGLMD